MKRSLAILLLAGCAVGPDYEEPKTESAAAFRNAEWLATQCDMGRELFAHTRQRVEQALAARRGA